MRRDFQMAWGCAIRAARGFHWGEYAPFGWILGAQVLFLLLAVRLETPLGMATVGGLTRLLAGSAPLHYPDFFLFLPKLASIVEAFLFVVLGSVLIPLAVIRIHRGLYPRMASATPTARRLSRAFAPTLVAWLFETGLLLGWQWVVAAGFSRFFPSTTPGDAGFVAVWTLSVLGAYAIAALFVYVPIVAVVGEIPFGETLWEGIHDGLYYFRSTWILIVLLSLPALPFLLLTQLRAVEIVDRLRPELVALLLLIYSALVSISSYLIFAAAMRLHTPVEEDEQ